LRKIWIMPVMAFRGVRISWLMLARKALLATLPASAAFLAIIRSWVRDSTSASSRSRWAASSASTCLRSVISLTNPIATHLPCMFMVDSASSMANSCPFLRRAVSSTPEPRKTPCPLEQKSFRPSAILSRKRGGTRNSCKTRPITSSAV